VNRCWTLRVRLPANPKTRTVTPQQAPPAVTQHV